MEALIQRSWWNYLEEDLQELIKQSVLLLQKSKGWEERFHDYSFIVFPAAKAYEGFLKKLFLDMKFISQDDYYGKRFRVGKALNPSLEPHLRGSEGVYDKIVEYCGGVKTADALWNTWKSCRNLLFHWFPDERNTISLAEADTRLDMVFKTFDIAYKECILNKQTTDSLSR